MWWDIRPSNKYPTIELRVCDVCPRVEDTMTLVALYACLIRKVMRTKSAGSLVSDEILTEIIFENRFQAQRYGIFAFLADPNDTKRTDIADILDRLISEIQEDAEALDCVNEIEHAQAIVRNGTSADRQLDQYRLALLNQTSTEEALREVVDTAVQETIEKHLNKESRSRLMGTSNSDTFCCLNHAFCKINVCCLEFGHQKKFL